MSDKVGSLENLPDVTKIIRFKGLEGETVFIDEPSGEVVGELGAVSGIVGPLTMQIDRVDFDENILVGVRNDTWITGNETVISLDDVDRVDIARNGNKTLVIKEGKHDERE